MTDLADQVAGLIKLNDGRIVGKTRLQKVAYLLEAKKLGMGIEFDYHNFGPFSEDLALAADDAVALGFVHANEQYGFHSVPYTIYSAAEKCPAFDSGDVRARKSALNTMNEYSALVLELAATAIYLKNNGYPQEYWNEVKRRKPLKATSELISSAKELNSRLKL